MERDTSLCQSLAIQVRVIGALVMREIITRFGRHNIGFFWMFAEPMLFAIGVTVIWINLHPTISRQLPVAAFCVTGYSTILLWRNCGNRCCAAITPNLTLLYHRNVRVIDVLLARIVLEVSGCAMSFLILMAVFISTGFMDPPENWILTMGGYLMMVWFTVSLSLWVGAFSELSEVFDRTWHVMTYFMLPLSGLGFMVEWLPVKVQRIAVLVPMVNGTEMLRGGYFGTRVHCHYSAPYLSCWCLGLMLIGLALLKLFSGRVEPHP